MTRQSQLCRVWGKKLPRGNSSHKGGTEVKIRVVEPETAMKTCVVG